MTLVSKVRWVRQEHRSGCALAALAMVTGQTYQYVHDYLNTRVGRHIEDSPGKYKWVIGVDAEEHGVAIFDDGLFFLRDHGYAYQKRYRSPYTTGYEQPKHDPWPCEPWADVHIAVVATSASHALVLLKDGTVLDPMTPDPRRLSDYSTVESITAVYRVAI
jgi:hypothetical protein